MEIGRCVIDGLSYLTATLLQPFCNPTATLLQPYCNPSATLLQPLKKNEPLGMGL